MLKRLMAMVVIFGFALSSASAQMSLEEKEKKMLTAYVTAYASMYGVGVQNPSYNFPDLPRPALKVSAQKVADEFHENQLSAEKMYKGKVLWVEGKVKAIQKTSYAGLLTVLDTANFYHGESDAQMRDDMADILADYKVGQDISLICSSGAIYDLIPTYKGCIVRSEVKKDAAKIAEKVVDAFLEGKKIDSMMQSGSTSGPSGFLFSIKYLAQFVPDNSPCLSIDTFKECHAGEFMPKDFENSPEFKKAYASSGEFFHLPQMSD